MVFLKSNGTCYLLLMSIDFLCSIFKKIKMEKYHPNIFYPKKRGEKKKGEKSKQIRTKLSIFFVSLSYVWLSYLIQQKI